MGIIMAFLRYSLLVSLSLYSGAALADTSKASFDDAEESAAAEVASAPESAPPPPASTEPAPRPETTAAPPPASYSTRRDLSADPITTEVEPIDPAVTATAGASAVGAAKEQDNEAVFRAFKIVADSDQRMRYAGGIATLVSGVGVMAVGAAISEANNDDPTIWIVTGGIVAGTSLFYFLIPNRSEKIADKYEVERPKHSKEEAIALDTEWMRYVDMAEQSRYVSGTTSIVFGVGAIGFGTAVLLGAFNWSSSYETTVGSILLASGGAMILGGIANFVIPTFIERERAIYDAARGNKSAAEIAMDLERQSIKVNLGLSTVPGGLGLGASGSF